MIMCATVCVLVSARAASSEESQQCVIYSANYKKYIIIMSGICTNVGLTLNISYLASENKRNPRQLNLEKTEFCHALAHEASTTMMMMMMSQP